MDLFFEILYRVSPLLHILASVALFTKTILVWNRHGLHVPAIVFSVFRIYSKTELSLNYKQGVLSYRKLHNIINYYLYAWIFANVLILIVFGKL